MSKELRRARLWQIGFFLLICISLLALMQRLVYWQLQQHGLLAAMAHQQQPITVPAGRGSIYDANGTLLALNVMENAVVADPQVIQQANGDQPGTFDNTLSQLVSILNVPAAVLRPKLLLSQQGQPATFTYLYDSNNQKIYATQDQSNRITALLNNGQLGGIWLLPESVRHYVDGSLAAQLLGFVQQGGDNGQYGLEQYYNDVLVGQPGKLIAQADANGNPLALGNQVWSPPVNGANLTLTLDANVQATVERMLHDTIVQHQADSGSVIIVNPKTGAIIAMASEPSFDPNHYNQVSPADYQLFTNPITTGSYDPGSTMKAITMSAALDLHLITPDTSFYDPGYYNVNGVLVHNFDDAAYGTETMTQVLQHSANVGAIWVVLNKLGSANFYHYLSQFGFGALTNVDLPNENQGQIPPPATRTTLDLAENSFGESVNVTPLQMVMAYAALANGGVLMQPYVVSSISQNGHSRQFGPQAVRQVISPQTAQTITNMLVQSAINGEAEQALVPGYQIAAKTGTSTPPDKPANYTYASVAGYAPASNPQFVMLVKIDHPRQPIFGGGVAGPLWHNIAAWLFNYYRIPPDQPTTGG
ncbi:MAG TPA: penicillin-binding protein 2 [Ktedonobacterales bacterium]|nr:penicillin-binding protein 2 [Ktedonobacterales bacterium]